jgi:thermitase
MKHTSRIAIFVMLLCAFFAALPPVAAHAGNYVPGEAIVVLKNKTGGLSAASLEASASSGHVAQVAASAGASATKTFSALSASSGSVFAVFKSEAKTTEQLVAELKANPDVIAVSPNYVVHALGDPSDYSPGYLWGMTAIGAPAAWTTITSPGDGVAVAVVDSGITIHTPGMYGNVDLDRSRNFATLYPLDITDTSYEGHGTHVSGTIAAPDGDSDGIVGVSFKSKIIALKVLDPNTNNEVSKVIEAINHIINNNPLNNPLAPPIKAANFSIGFYYQPTSAGIKLTGADLLDDAIYMAFKELDKLNKTVIVVASGNDGDHGVKVGEPVPNRFFTDGSWVEAGSICAPASYIGLNNMIVVGSVKQSASPPPDYAPSTFANWSKQYVHVAAPGEDIISTSKSGGITNMGGTSMAAPHVSGAVALLASSTNHNSLNATELKSHLLRHTTTNITDLNALCAYGLLNVGEAANANFTVQPITGIAVRTPRRIFPGDVFFAAAEIAPENASNKTLTWSSSNPGVAAIDASGKVTAVAVGTATITATAANGVFGSANITVSSVSGGGGGGGGGGDGGGGSMGCNAGALAAIPFAAFAYALIRRKSRRN